MCFKIPKQNFNRESLNELTKLWHILDGISNDSSNSGIWVGLGGRPPHGLSGSTDLHVN